MTKQKPLPKTFKGHNGYVSGVTVRKEVQLRLAKWYAQGHGEGAHGIHGGWLYTAELKPIAQGWDSYYGRRRRQIWEALEASLQEKK